VKPVVRRAAAGVLIALLTSASASCSITHDKPSASPSKSDKTGAGATMNAKPVPLRIRVTRVSGKLKDSQKKALEHNVGKAISGYFEAAYLGGDYPRSDFGNAFTTFTKGAARKARHDKDLLTNASLGQTTESVTPKTTSAYLSVLAPNKVAAGVDARIILVYVADRGDKPAQQVEVTGRLMLTRKKSGGWQIFGYHVARSAGAATDGGS
jgi:tryptophan synthase beta subunit